MKYLAPAYLDADAKRKWTELATTLDTTQPGTLDALSCYCVAYSRWTAAEQQVAVLGAVVKSPSGFPVQNPYLAVAKDSQRQLRQWSDVLGLHKRPGRRKASGDDDQGGDTLLKLLGGTSKPTASKRSRKAIA